MCVKKVLKAFVKK